MLQERVECHVSLASHLFVPATGIRILPTVLLVTNRAARQTRWCHLRRETDVPICAFNSLVEHGLIDDANAMTAMFV